MKKIIKLFFILFFIGFLSSCNYRLKDVSVFYYDEDDIFLSELKDKLSFNMKNKYNFTNYYAKKSQLKQNLQVDERLKDSSLILMNMVDRLASGAIVEKCKKENVPVIFFNREPLLEDLITYEDCYYVGPDPEEQGKLQVDCAASIFGNPLELNPIYDLNHDNKIQLVILKGEQGHQDAERRTQSCLSSLRQKGYDIELISIGVCNWNRQEAYNLLLGQYNTTLKNVELILANNDEMAIGAASYLRSVTPMEKDIIPIIGVDKTLDGKKAVDDKLLSATIVNDDQGQVDAICNLVDIFMDSKLTIRDLKYPIKDSKFVYIKSSIYLRSEE